MNRADLKLLKSTKPGTRQAPRLRAEVKYSLHITRSPQLTHETKKLLPDLTPAEHAEAARFRALTMERAARQARVRRLIMILGKADQRTSGVA